MMPQIDFADILRTLPALNRKQLEELRTKAAFFIQRRPDVNVSMEDEDWLLSGIKKELVRRGLEKPDFVFRKNDSYRSFVTTSVKVRELLEEAAPGLSLVERRYLGEIAAKELARYLRVEITLRSMLEHASQIPQALNRAFPGYMEGRMLGIVIRQPRD